MSQALELTQEQLALLKNSQVGHPWPVKPAQPWLSAILLPSEVPDDVEKVVLKGKHWVGDGKEYAPPYHLGQKLYAEPYQVRIISVGLKRLYSVGLQPMEFFQLGLFVEQVFEDAKEERAAYTDLLREPYGSRNPWLWAMRFVRES